jgi:hypothetical protein
MAANIRERGQIALSQIPEAQLPAVVRWLELLAEMKDYPDVEPEELWLLVTGELQKMDEEIKDARVLDDWRKYLDEV